RAIAFFPVAAVHGFVLAAVAVALGDRGPRQDRRLSISPFAHVSVWGLIGAIGFQFGWVRPIQIDWSQLRMGRVGEAASALVAIASMLGFAVLLQFLRPLALNLLPGSG